MFSIVIPVFNKVGTLARCLDSVLAQAGDDVDVVAVDDGSTDGSRDLLRAYAQSHGVRLFWRDAPGPGGYAARNLGARQAHGEWLLFLDADDYVAPDHLATFHEAIGGHGKPLDLIVSGHTKVSGLREERAWMPPSPGFLSQSQILRQLAQSDFIHMNSVCVRRSRFVSMGGFPDGRFRRGGDVYTWVRLVLSVEGLYHTARATSYWVQDSSEVTRNPANLTGLHPLCVLADEVAGEGVSVSTMDHVRAIAARKSLAWAVEKKRQGLGYWTDVRWAWHRSLLLRKLPTFIYLSLPGRFL